MATEFDNSLHWGFFLTGPTLTSETGKYVRVSELVLSALRAAGVFSNMVDGIVAPATDKLWLDKNFDPAVLKEWDVTGASWVPMTYGRLFGRAAVDKLTVTGGTGNAVVVSQPIGFQADRLYLMTPTADNSGATTITVSGVGTYGVKYGDGSNIEPIEFKTARQAVLFFTGVRFEVIFPLKELTSAVMAAQASAGAAAASQSAAAGSAGAASTSATNAANSATAAANSVAALPYNFSTTTTDADPGAGIFRLNNAAPASATAAYIDNVDSDGVTATGMIDTWDDSTNTVRGALTIRSKTNAAIRHTYNVTGSVVDGTGYRKLTLAYVGGSGTLTNGAAHWLIFDRTGDGNAEVWLNIDDFGAVVNSSGVDNAVAIQAAIDAGIAQNRTVYIPGGVYYTSNIVLKETSRLRGEGPVQSTLRAKSGTTGTLVSTATTDDADIQIMDLSFDGNWPTVTSGNTVHIRGSRPVIRNVTIINSAGVGLTTDYVLTDRLYSILGHFDHITIDKSKTSGWVNNGPNDSFISHVEIVDASLGTNLSGYGYISTGSGTARIFDMHVWNRSPTGNKPIAGASIANNGNIILGSHFESGERSMIVTGSYNMFDGCSWYAPDGVVALLVGGSYNKIKGMVGGGADALFANFAGLVLGLDAANKSGSNFIELLDAGCNNGAIDFTNSAGNNVVQVRGAKAGGTLSYFGTPLNTDDVDIQTVGAGGVTLVKPANGDWVTTFVPVVTPSAGSITTKSATCRYLKVGKTVHIKIVVSITTNGTGAGVVRATLPFTPENTTTLSGIDGTTLATLTGATNTAGTLVSIVTAAGAYPGADGKTLIVSGTYEAQ